MQDGGPGLDRSLFRRMLVTKPAWASQQQQEQDTVASQQLPQNVAGSEPLWAEHVAKLTAILGRCLPPFWQLAQVPTNPDSAWGLAACACLACASAARIVSRFVLVEG